MMWYNNGKQQIIRQQNTSLNKNKQFHQLINATMGEWRVNTVTRKDDVKPSMYTAKTKIISWVAGKYVERS